jgi:hypothetical protein
MVKIFDAKDVQPYSLKNDTVEPKTIFYIGALSGRFYQYLTDKLVDKDPKPGSFLREVVRFGIKGWEHFWDGTSEVPFDTNLYLSSHPTPIGPQTGLTDKGLDLIPWYAQQELFNAVVNANKITKADEKNSDTPSQ